SNLVKQQEKCKVKSVKVKTQNSKFKKESFWVAKRVLLGAKRSPFTMQNESFWNAKGLVLKISCSNVVWLTIVSYMSLTQQM
ncbi:hypothetical protein, partial [uncultured Prevotella sp.]|uniref:hypothetical protein n=1 Tax=uncultured Prevotella sp. TaxID=159272 RepID=UPI00266CE855